METLETMLIVCGALWILAFLGLGGLIARFVWEDHRKKPQSLREHALDAMYLVRDNRPIWMVRDKSMGRNIGPFVTKASADAFAQRSPNLIVINARKESPDAR